MAQQLSNLISTVDWNQYKSDSLLEIFKNLTKIKPNSFDQWLIGATHKPVLNLNPDAGGQTARLIFGLAAGATATVLTPTVISPLAAIVIGWATGGLTGHFGRKVGEYVKDRIRASGVIDVKRIETLIEDDENIKNFGLIADGKIKNLIYNLQLGLQKSIDDLADTSNGIEYKRKSICFAEVSIVIILIVNYARSREQLRKTYEFLVNHLGDKDLSGQAVWITYLKILEEYIWIQNVKVWSQNQTLCIEWNNEKSGQPNLIVYKPFAPRKLADVINPDPYLKKVKAAKDNAIKVWKDRGSLNPEYRSKCTEEMNIVK